MKSINWMLNTALKSLAAFFLYSQTTHASTITLDWSPCTERNGVTFECATAQLPLKYSKYWPYVPFTSFLSQQETTSVALIRLPATDPANKKGSIFFNPGGPGGSGIDFLLYSGTSLFSDEVRANYDFIGFDPRGTNRSSPVVCFESAGEAISIINGMPYRPTNLEEVNERRQLDEAFSDQCRLEASDLMYHMSTADVAKDLELLRRAVGDNKLNYVGISYGTYLGVLYANLFPQNVGKMVIDGVLDPVAWSRGRGLEWLSTPFSNRIRSDAGSIDTLNEFFRLCEIAGLEECAFAGDSATRFHLLAERMKTSPRYIERPNGAFIEFDYEDLIQQTLRALYNSFSWTKLSEFLVLLEQEASPQILGDSLYNLQYALGESELEPSTPNQTFERFWGVSCADTYNPLDYNKWFSASQQAENQYGYFGPHWNWISSACHSWPASRSGAYTGFFSSWTATPVLVMNSLYDPATPYEGAETVDSLLPRSRLLTVNGWGHPSLHLSQCAIGAVSEYLLSGTLPPIGTVCDQNYIPFGLTDEALPRNGANSSQASINPFNQHLEHMLEQRRELMRSILPHIPRK